MRVAVVGATGAVGRELLGILRQRKFPVGELHPLASERSAGKRITFKGKETSVEVLNEGSFDGVDIAFFCVGSELSRRYAPIAVNAGAFVIDNSSAFRLDEDVPLVVPEVNPDAIGDARLIANANCTTTIMLVAVAPLHRRFGIRRIIACSYQAVSGAGNEAIDELLLQSERYLNGEREEPSVFPHPIAFNLLPHIDTFGENLYTKEEMKIVYETQKILSDERMLISSTCVRVPVVRAHSVAVHIELKEDATVEDVRSLLEEAEGVVVMDEPYDDIYPTPRSVSGKDDVFVGRIRKDLAFDKGVAMWVSGDQLRKGAALNAVQIAEMMIGRVKR